MSSTRTQTAAVVIASALVPVGLVGMNVVGANAASTVASSRVASAGTGGLNTLPTAPSDGTTSQGAPDQGWGSQGYGGGYSGNGWGSTSQDGNGWGGAGNGWGSSPNGWGRMSQGGEVSGTPVASAKGVVLVDTQTAGGTGAGTGITLTSDGTVLTNYHVVEGSTKIRVTDSTSGKTFAATVVGHDQSHDVAVLRLEGASGLSTAVVNGSTASVGSPVTAVGQGGGQGVLYAAKGTITATGQSITAADENGASSAEKLTGLLQTSADVVPGYSGGPLLDAQDRVIGIDTAASSGGDINGYAVPIAQALDIAKTIQAGQRTDTVHIGPRAGLGVSVSTVRQTPGAGVIEVLPGSAAAKSGITAGSVITAVDGKSVASASALTEALSDDYPGSKVTITWTDQQGADHSRQVTLGTSQAN